MLVWSSWSPYAISACCQLYTAVLDLGTMVVTEFFIKNPIDHDMFCPGVRGLTPDPDPDPDPYLSPQP